MFDGIINRVTGFLKDSALMFVVAALIAEILFDVTGEGFDVKEIIQLMITALAAGITTSIVVGAADG